MVFVSKKQKYKEERELFTNNLLKVLDIENDEFSVNKTLFTNNDKKIELELMIEDFKKYFKIPNSFKPSYNKKLKNPVLTMVKCVLKQQDINFQITEKTTKLDKGKYKSLKFYKILRN